MVRSLRLLTLALLLATPAALLLPAGEAACEDSADPCGAGGTCDATCVWCACCVNRAPNLTATPAVEPADAPARPIAGGTASAMPSPPASDILHVPKSA